MSGPVRTEAVDGVLRVTLDRPPANAVDVGTSQALYAAFRRLHDDPGLRVGILTGAGDRFFCAGWDLKAAAAGEAIDADHGPGGFAGLTELFDLRKPVIAAVNGLAVGGGFELALAADLIVAADHVELSVPEVRLGKVSDSGGVLRLPKLLPPAVAADLLLTGRPMGAAEAHRWGLVTAVVPAEQLGEHAMALARRICESAPLAVAAVKEIQAATASLSVREGYALLRSGRLAAYEAMLSSEDAEEGPRAFAERRPPTWRGR